MPWKNKNKKKLFKGKFLQVEEWTVEDKEQKIHNFEIVQKPDSIFILPITKDDEIIYLKQYSAANEEYVNHLVAGYIEENEKPVEAAERELKEETGYEAKEIKKVGKVNRSKWITGKYYFFIAKDLTKESTQNLDSSEDITVKKTSLKEFKKMLKESNIQSLGSLACAYKAIEKIES